MKIIYYFGILVLSGIFVHANPRNRIMCWFSSKASIGTVLLFYILQQNNNKDYILPNNESIIFAFLLGFDKYSIYLTVNCEIA